MSSINVNPLTLKKPLRILMVTGIYPTQELPYKGMFIKSQVDSLASQAMVVRTLERTVTLEPDDLLRRRLASSGNPALSRESCRRAFFQGRKEGSSVA